MSEIKARHIIYVYLIGAFFYTIAGIVASLLAEENGAAIFQLFMLVGIFFWSPVVTVSIVLPVAFNKKYLLYRKFWFVLLSCGLFLALVLLMGLLYQSLGKIGALPSFCYYYNGVTMRTKDSIEAFIQYPISALLLFAFSLLFNKFHLR